MKSASESGYSLASFVRESLMGSSPVSSDDFLAISPRIRVMPIIHGSGDFAIQVREELLKRAV